MDCVERALVVLVAVLAGVLFLTSIIVQPDVGALAAGVFLPDIPAGAPLTTIALIGTTVVPYHPRRGANGLLLPIVAGFLLVVMNRAGVLGRHTNGRVANILGGLVFLVVTGLALYQFADIFGLLSN